MAKSGGDTGEAYFLLFVFSLLSELNTEADRIMEGGKFVAGTIMK